MSRTFSPLMGTAMRDADEATDKVLEYREFLERKAQLGTKDGFEAIQLPSELFDFQRALTDWALWKGRCALFADCGLGKTPMQLAWADNVVRKTNKPVLLLTPLGVANQTVREGEKFHIQCKRSEKPESHITIANYERLHYFSPDDFSGVVCDESSAIKAFNGARRTQVTEFMKKLPYRLLCTATAAPNDYTELGTSSEALGEMGLMDMLGRFFKNDQNSAMVQNGRTRFKKEYGQKWRFKGHAEKPFFRWVCSWARACRKPSDIGFSDEHFQLPPLVEREHIVETRSLPLGKLFPVPAENMHEEREERRRTIQERCEKAADLVYGTKKPAVIWCHLNDEGDLLEQLILGGRQVSGKHSDEEKEELFDAFSTGQLRVLIIKPKIGAWGLNWQHCAHVVTFASHSYEQYYQSVRRCWRFGQKSPVIVDIIATEGERGAKDNLRRKSEQADKMFTELVSNMNQELKVFRGNNRIEEVRLPSWL